MLKEIPKYKKIEFLRCFCESSSLNGLKYILQQHLSPILKIFWCTLIVIAFVTTINISTTTILRFLHDPTVVTIDHDHFAWNTTFPAITICPIKKINYDLLDKYVEYMMVPNKTLLREFLIRLAYADYTNFELIPFYDLIVPDTYMELLLEFQYNFEGVITTSTVMSSASENRVLHLTKIISEMGICYSFNTELALYNSPEYFYFYI